MKVFPAYSVLPIKNVECGSLFHRIFRVGAFWCLKCRWADAKGELQRVPIVALGPKLPSLNESGKLGGVPFWADVLPDTNVLCIGDDFTTELPTEANGISEAAPDYLEVYAGVALIGDQLYLRLSPQSGSDDEKFVHLESGTISFELPKGPKVWFPRWKISIPGRIASEEPITVVSYPDGE